MATEKRRMAQLTGTPAEFDTENPVLLNGELAALDSSGLLKMGDGSTAYKDLPFLPSAQPYTEVSASSYNVSANDVGRLVRLTNAVGIDINVLGFDTHDPSAPSGPYFPKGGYVMIATVGDANTANTPLIDITPGANCVVELYDDGTRQALPGSTAGSLNGGRRCNGKLYMLYHEGVVAGVGQWKMWELDSRDVWETARGPGTNLPQYLSMVPNEPGISATSSVQSVNLELADILEQSAGFTVDVGVDNITIVEAGKYEFTLSSRVNLDGLDNTELVVSLTDRSSISITCVFKNEAGVHQTSESRIYDVPANTIMVIDYQSFTAGTGTPGGQVNGSYNQHAVTIHRVDW